MSAVGIAQTVLEIGKLVLEDISMWLSGGESKLDYSEFAEKLGEKFKSEILLEREKARLARKRT